MAILSTILGFFSPATAQPIEAVGNVLDKLFTSDAEKLDRKIIMQRLAQQPQIAQVELNKVEAQHRSLFVAGWRPFIGWVCGAGLAFTFVINPIIQWLSTSTGPTMATDVMMELVVALLGLGGLRTLEKGLGKSK